jgi:hypothetical protein
MFKYGLIPPHVEVMMKMEVIKANTWDSLGNWEILQSLEIGIRVLSERNLGKGELFYISLLIQDLAKIISDRLEE